MENPDLQSIFDFGYSKSGFLNFGKSDYFPPLVFYTTQLINTFIYCHRVSLACFNPKLTSLTSWSVLYYSMYEPD